MVMNKAVINIAGIILLVWAAYAFFNQQPPICSSIYPDIISDNSKPGDSIKWTARAQDPNSDPLVYKFSISNSRGQWLDGSSWISDNTWVWNTNSDDIGSFLVKVDVRDRYHAGSGGSDASISSYYTIKNNPPTVEITVSPEADQDAGNPVAIEASAWDREGDVITYEFQHKGPSSNSWNTLEKSGSYEYKWSPGGDDIGQNYIRVIVSDSLNPEGTKSNEASIEITDPEPTINSLRPDLESPQIGGAIITWTAQAVDKFDNTIYYKFFLTGPSTGGQSTAMMDWTRSFTWTWVTSSADIGENQIKVWIRDGNHAGTDSFDDADSAYFVIEAAPAPVYDNDVVNMTI
jgi:hypothetical protein